MEDARFSHFSTLLMLSWNSWTCLLIAAALLATSFESEIPWILAASTSKPAVKALSPAPEMITARTSGLTERASMTVLSSSHMASMKALSF